ncbi:hypothetical protein FHX72_002369 [Pseudoclavibacter helvolus]|uniref:Uncharacterized protein n=1 Tax=Pseudoclavibacter helvolus TaxID=255205 RepID=A0A7W4UPG5_9MICO|nr:hypothetical protein [Pseudoclavibacter helvolus]
MKTNTVTKTSELDPTTSSGADGSGTSSTTSGPNPPKRDAHGLPTGATLLAWTREHPDATIADAVAAY